MSELELHKEFFKAWEELQNLPKVKGRPSMERMAAEELVKQRAVMVKNYLPGVTVDAGRPSAASAYLGLRQEISAIPPKDTRTNG